MAATVLPTDTPALFDKAVDAAVSRLKRGEVVALPTETVYGLAANAFDPSAVQQIFHIKGRPSHNPIIVHVASLELARHCVTDWPDAAQRLANSFWPGPLTLVLPRSEKIPSVVTAGGSTVGIRWPQHPLIQEVIRRCGFPLAAPSANLSNHLSPTSAGHVYQHLGNALELIVDGGQSQVGIESTVLDLTAEPYRVLRPGMISIPSLSAAANAAVASGPNAALSKSEPLRSPGLLSRHYSPKARLRVLSWRTEADLHPKLLQLGCSPAHTHLLCHDHIPLSGQWPNVHVVPHDPEAFARALYGELHRCDAAGAKWIIVEQLPDAPDWMGIADRLSRAMADSD